MKTLKTLSLVLILMTSFGVSTVFLHDANAQSRITIAQAKNQGLVGEKADGLLGIVNPPGTLEIRKIVEATNTGRMTVYRDAARRQNVRLITVKVLAGKNLRKKTPAGHYILHGGNWVQKKAFPEN